MKKTKFGLGNEGIAASAVATSGTTVVDTVVPIMDTDNISFTLLTTGTIAGAWTILASNDWNELGAYNGQARSGNFVDVTALFTTMAAVLTGGTARYCQSSQPMSAKALMVRWTPTSGTGTISIYTYQKSNG